ncbi:MAG: LPS assembly lipoprotein LptE [Gammaproteobacteria bacterium]|nr:LPS assembly lipoprotein LptE [Gammaproteobacteria bacterium]
MTFRALIQILVAASLVTGCGFHLRGQLPLPEQLKVIAVSGTDGEFTEEMIDALETSGAQVVDEAEARALLDLYNVEFSRTVRTIDTRGKVTGYILRYEVSYRIVDDEGEELRDTSMAMQRDYNFDPEQVLQAEQEEESLREDMVGEMVQRIMRQLVTIAGLTIEAPSPGERA